MEWTGLTSKSEIEKELDEDHRRVVDCQRRQQEAIDSAHASLELVKKCQVDTYEVSIVVYLARHSNWALR